MLEIRSVRPDDIGGLYAVSLATGHEGRDASHLYRDGQLIGHIYSAPYALLEPELALVVEDDQGIAGFAVGTADTAAWFERLERDWWPRLRTIYPDPGAVPSGEWPADQKRAFMIHHPRPTPREISLSYPAHLHLNLMARAQGKGIGARLFSQWLEALTGKGACRLHIGANRANPRASRFWTRQGFAPLPEAYDPGGRTVWMGYEATGAVR